MSPTLADARPALGGIVTAVRSGLGRNLEATVHADAEAAGLPVDGAAGPVVTADDLDGLPAAARRYLRFMGVVGRPRERMVTVHARGRFRMRPRMPWLHYESWQLNTVDPIARVFHMRIDAGPIPLVGADTLLGGRGEMKGRVLGLVPIVESRGPEMDTGELVTWLNDAVLLAPTMLLRAGVEWDAVDEHSFGVTICDHGVQVTARVVVGSDGAPRTFETFDRYVDVGRGLERARWATPVSGWTTVGGYPQFTDGAAVWELPGGEFQYARTTLRSGDVVHGATPSRS